MADSIAQLASYIIEDYDYHKAVDFIHKYGDERISTLLKKLTRSSFTEDLAEKEIKRLRGTYKKNNATISSSKKNVSSTSNYKEECISKRNSIVRQLDFKCGSLEYIDNENERLKVALEILELEDELREIWVKLDYYDRTGYPMPDTPDDEIEKVFHGVIDIADLLRIRNNHRTYLTRAKKQSDQKKITYHTSIIKKAEDLMHKKDAV